MFIIKYTYNKIREENWIKKTVGTSIYMIRVCSDGRAMGIWGEVNHLKVDDQIKVYSYVIYGMILKAYDKWPAVIIKLQC